MNLLNVHNLHSFLSIPSQNIQLEATGLSKTFIARLERRSVNTTLPDADWHLHTLGCVGGQVVLHYIQTRADSASLGNSHMLGPSRYNVPETWTNLVMMAGRFLKKFFQILCRTHPVSPSCCSNPWWDGSWKIHGLDMHRGLGSHQSAVNFETFSCHQQICLWRGNADRRHFEVRCIIQLLIVYIRLMPNRYNCTVQLWPIDSSASDSWESQN